MKSAPIGEAISHAIGGGWGSDEPSDFTTPVVVIRGADFPHAALQSLQGAPVRHEATSKVGQRTLQAGDLVLEISGGTKNRPTGRTVLITERMVRGSQIPIIPASFCRLVRVDPTTASPRFIYYVLQQLHAEGGTWEFQNQSTGLSNFQFELFRSKFRYPALPLGEQSAIAEVMGSLDDKIATNAKIASTVDDLLAAEFAKTVKGAPAGLLGAIADVNVKSTKPQGSGLIHYVDIASVGVGSYELSEAIDWCEAPGRARRVLQRGDTVWSTVRPNRRSHALVLDELDNLIASTGLAVLSPKHGRFAYVYEATRTEAFTAYLEGVAEGSAYPAVRSERFATAPVPVLSDDDIDQFEIVAAPLRLRSHAASLESRKLGELRDALLPQLMSGKIRVKDAERVVEGVV